MNTSKTLGTLIQERKNSNGWSFRDLENRSPKGAGLNKSRWGELLRDEVKTFNGEQLRGIAEALSVPAHVVGRAALASMGLPEGGTTARTVEDVVRTDYNLSEHDRRILLAVLTAMRTESGPDGRTEEEVTEPGTQESYPPAMSRAGVSPAYDPDQHRLYGTKTEATETAREIVQAEQPGVTAVPAAPRPDEYALAASDEPSEGRARRSIQDTEAEASQDDGDWDPA
ncbi:hypothetical protein CKW39_08760 [Kocuria sp. WRN011]|uniref:hypothetical protein n=1 Tax=Kocuria sp. WRN011 TaxID=2029858 RepID=UPI000BAF4B67|nr:hypothetical protein [Kocuria sp. WRN011]PBB08443.1 hypothetical protein CKW39_08760 [Kocuria sp. WRN011]